MLGQLRHIETIPFELSVQRKLFLIGKTIKAVIAELKKAPASWAKNLSWLRAATWILWGLSFAVLSWTGYNVIRDVHREDARLEDNRISEDDPSLMLSVRASDGEHLPVDIKLLASRNPFRPLIAPEPAKPKTVLPPAPPPPPRIPLKERASRFRLMGILPPAQAIVEDTSNHQTLYLSEGQFINEILVEKILDEKIILKFEDERLELAL